MADLDPCPDLASAREALDAGDGARALLALLEAWRKARSPRIAELVDRVARDVTAAHPLPKAKSVKERTAAVLTVLRKKNPVRLGAALEQPWPGKWQDAEPVLEAFCAQPPDPRVAMALARLIDAAPYDTYRTDPFWNRLLTRVSSLADVRTLPVLESARARPRSPYFDEIKQSLGRTLEAVRVHAVTPLSEAANAHVAALEAHFAVDVRRAADKVRGEAELLAAIHADPDDLALRQVYADFLSEREDPRGEHIVLGLARREGRASAAALRREKALAKKLGEGWIGELDRVLSKDGRVFDAGFLCEAALELVSRREYRTLDAMPAALRDPALSTLRTLDVSRSGATARLIVEILALPTLSNLTALAGIDSATLALLGAKPGIRVLDVATHDEAGRRVLSGGQTFPGVVDLAIEAGTDLEWLLASPVARRLERLVVRSSEWPLGSVRTAVEHHGLPLGSLLFGERSSSDAAWLWTFTRDEAGHFTRLEGRSSGPSSVPSSFDFERALKKVPDDSLTVLEIAEHDVCNWDSSDIARAERQLERFPSARIRVAWRRPPKLAAPIGRPTPIHLDGPSLGATTRLAAVLDVVRAPPFDLVLDSYSEDSRNHVALDASEMPALAAKIFAKKRAPYGLHLYREGGRETSHLRVSGSDDSLEVTCAVEDSPEARHSFHRGLARLLDVLGDVERGGVPFAVRGHASIPCRVLGSRDSLGHVTVFGPAWLELLPVDELRALVGRPGLPQLVVIPAARAALLVIGSHPEDVPDAAGVAALELALAEILDRTFPRVRGYRLADAVLEGLADELAADGLVPTQEDPVNRLIGDRKLRSADGARRLELSFLDRLADTNLRVRTEGGFLVTSRDVEHPARDRQQLDESLEAIREGLGLRRLRR